MYQADVLTVNQGNHDVPYRLVNLKQMNNERLVAFEEVKKLQEEINVIMGLPRNAMFTPPSKSHDLFIFRRGSEFETWMHGGQMETALSQATPRLSTRLGR